MHVFVVKRYLSDCSNKRACFLRAGGILSWVAVVVQYIQEIQNESSNGVFVKYKWEEVNVQVRA
jgi:hypothetical protein